MEIIDTNSETTNVVRRLRNEAGVQCVIRYITTATGNEKCVKPAEARAMAQAGLKLALVFENYGGVDNFRHGDIDAMHGQQHGSFARSWAAHVGAPAGTLLWFAIDTDVAETAFAAHVRPYLTAARAALDNNYRIGVYGGGFCCMAALNEGLVSGTWLAQSMGWYRAREFRDSNKWTLLQGPEGKLYGLSIDPNRSTSVVPTDYGAFTPFGMSEVPTPAQVVNPQVGFSQQGLVSWYGDPQKLASGGRLDPHALTAAHRTLPFGCKVKVVNDKNERAVVVTVNDRGPYVRGRILDLTPAAFQAIATLAEGVIPAHIEVVA